jgi:hypothetical protein
VVPAGQPSGLLAFYLLEPESDDGLQPFLGAVLAPRRDFPVVRVTAPATLTTRPVP